MRRTRTATLAVSALMALAIEASAQSVAYTQAIEAFRAHRWAEAAAAFNDCEKTDPGKTDALLYRGKSLVNLGQFPAADDALKTYKTAHPESEDAVYLLAFVRFRENKPEESLQLFTDAAKLRTPTADDLKIVALDYVLLSDFDDAAHYLEVALGMDSKNVEARYHLGRVRYQQNRFDLAIAAFQEVLRLDPENVKAQDNLGLSLDAENKTDQAIAAYQRAIELDAKATVHSEQPYLNLGALLDRSNRVEEAIPLLARASEISPKSSAVHYEMGKAYFGLNRFEEARRETELSVSLEPGDRSAHYLLGRIYQRMGKSDMASEQFHKTEGMIHENDAKPGSGMASGTSPH